MKLRTGFVSNSSSSSFLIYGISIDENKFDELVVENEDDWSKRDTVRKSGLDVFKPPYGNIYVGLSWDSIGDDETGGQFKSRVESLISKVFGESFEHSTYEDSWYDG